MRKMTGIVLSVAIGCFVPGTVPGTAEAKSPAASFAMSFFVPSSGQFYNGQVGKGLLVLGVEAVGAGIFAAGAAKTMVMGVVTKEADAGSMTAGIFLMAGGWIYSFIDAPVSSAKINRERNRNSLSLNVIQGDSYTGLAVSKRF